MPREEGGLGRRHPGDDVRVESRERTRTRRAGGALRKSKEEGRAEGREAGEKGGDHGAPRCQDFGSGAERAAAALKMGWVDAARDGCRLGIFSSAWRPRAPRPARARPLASCGP